MQDRPNVLELLGAVQSFLAEDVVPALDGRRRFLALVSANVLAIVARELTGEEERTLEEWRRLATLLSLDGEPPPRIEQLRNAVGEQTRVLAERIRNGDADGGPWVEAVRAHVRQTVIEKLRVANPRYLGA